MAENDTPRREIPLTGAPGTPAASPDAVVATPGSQSSVGVVAVPPTSTFPGTNIPVTGIAPTVNVAGSRASAPTPPARAPADSAFVAQLGSSTPQTPDGTLPNPVTSTAPSTSTAPVLVPSTDSTTTNTQQLPAGPARVTQAPTDEEFLAILNDTVNSDPSLAASLTDGTLPGQDAVASHQQAQDALAREQVTASPDSPDQRPAGTNGTPQDIAPVTGNGTAMQPPSVLSTPAMLPHKFAESQYPVYHHDVIVYIQGVDVSDWLTGTVTILNNPGSDPNTCDITLDNAMNRFILTPENMAGIWRVSADEAHAQYSERAKKAIYEIKSPLGNNPVDERSGARMWPLDLWTSILHKGDPVRVWIRNPLNPEANEYMPMFTGYVHHTQTSRGFVSRDSTITVSCQDIRYLMRQMRTNTNTVLFVQPGEVLTENATQYSESGPIELDRGGGAFSQNFFQDLVVSSSTYANPWANVPLFQMIAALTYAGPGRAQAIVDAASAAGAQSALGELERAKQLLASSSTNASNQLARQSRVNALQRAHDSATVFRDSAAASTSNAPNSTSASQNQSAAPNPQTAGTNNGTQSIAPNPQLNAQPAAQSTGANAPANPQSATQPADPRSSGTGRIGRLSAGFLHAFPSQEDLPNEDAVPTRVVTPGEAPAAVAADGSALMTSWTSLIVFGLPEWTVSGEPDNQNVPIDRDIIKNASTCKYWTLDQVQRVGAATRSNRACAPDTQLVHILKPGVGTAGDAVIQDNNYAISDVANVQRQWMSRLDLLAKGCEAVDYKFYISPSGDLIFEFPQYDFLPKDYNKTTNIGWQPVYEFDYDLISEQYAPEVGEIVNCVIVTGSLTGYTDFIDVAGNGAQTLDPEVFPHAVAYCPVLTMRHGVNIHTMSLPLLTDRTKLSRIAVLTFQRLLAQASTYELDVVYRPWLTLNRPVMNKEFTRYALTESITHTIGVRENSGPATTNLQLTFPRNVDQFGVPRYVTGGPSLPIYFGSIPGAETSIITRLREYSQQLLTRVQTYTSTNGVTVVPEGTANDFDLMGAPIPYGYDVYNVVAGSSGVTTIVDSGTVPVSVLATLATQLSNSYATSQGIITNRNNGTLTASQADDALNLEARRVQGIRNQLNSMGLSESTDLVGQFASSGVRIQDTVGHEHTADLPEVPEDQLCDLDRYTNSSPLGRAPDESFPRQIVRDFSNARRNPHHGVDYAAVLGERVFCVHDGIVDSTGTDSVFGPYVRVSHEGLGVVSVYAPVDVQVVVGAEVHRNDVLGTVAGDGPESANGVVLHFAWATTDGTIGTTKRFVPPRMFPVPLTRRPNFPKLESSFYEDRPLPDEAHPNPVITEHHGGFDISWGPDFHILGEPIFSTTSGHVAKTHFVGDGTTGGAATGNSVAVRDDVGGLHSYFHMQYPPAPTLVEGAPVSVGMVLGKVGSTGKSGGPHLHYQVEPGSEVGLRVDVSARLAALAADIECVPGISIYEAQHTFPVKVPDLVAHPISIPSNSPETPVAGLTIDQIWARASGGSVRRAGSAPPSLTLTPSYTYHNSAIPPANALSVPYLPIPTNILHTDILTIVLVGDATARTLRSRLQAQLRTLLSRPDLVIDLVSVRTSKLTDWLASADDARHRARARALRGANSTALRNAAQAYDVVLASFVAADDFVAANVVRVNDELRSHNAAVMWLTHKQLPNSVVIARRQTIGQLVDAGTPREQVDSHARARAQLLASPVICIDIENGTPKPIALVRSDTGYSRNGLLNTRGQLVEAKILGYGIVQKLRAFATTAPTDAADSVTTQTPLWSDAQPPEMCPPARQRRLRDARVAAAAAADTSAPANVPVNPPLPPASTRPVVVYGGSFAVSAVTAHVINDNTHRECLTRGVAGADIAAWTAALTPSDPHDALVHEFGDVRVPTSAEVTAADAALRANGAVNVSWAVIDPWDTRASTSIRTARRNTTTAIKGAGVTVLSSESLTRARGQLEDDRERLTDSGYFDLALNVLPGLAST